MTAGYQAFEFDLPGALLDHLVRVLDGMESAPLNDGNLGVVEEAQGVYQLFLDGKLVYIGKTDAESGLLKRLTRHSWKIQHRHNLAPERISFKAVRIFVFTAMDLETQLIAHYGGDDGTAWNLSGFGSNDPGRNRDYSRPGRYDQEYPIDFERPLEGDFSGTHTAAQVALRLKSIVPYDFRFEARAPRARQPHPDLMETMVTISPDAHTAKRVLEELTAQLPPGWQATALAPMIILYKEKVDDYPEATVIARSPDQ